MNNNVRPTKKQKELLDFIDKFIKEHGYSPSYREIMRALNYNSVATVALHVKSLITRGHLEKRGRSARSLEVVELQSRPKLPTEDKPNPGNEKWLISKVESSFVATESMTKLSAPDVDQLYVLVGALKILGLEDAARAFIPRINQLKEKLKETK